MTKNTMTKREVLQVLCNAFQDPSYNEETKTSTIGKNFNEKEYEAICLYIDNELQLLAKKAAKAKSTSSKKVAEQDEVMSKITDFLAEGGNEPLSATEIGNGVGISVQKASALLKKLVESGMVIKRVDKKKKSFFSLADFSDSEV